MNSELTYLQQMHLFELDAVVTGVIEGDDGRRIVILDRTIFYPQGGGQPFDTGTIRGSSGVLEVEQVRWSEQGPHHIGVIAGSISVGDPVHLSVDPDRRELNTRLHSAGHVVDMAVDRLGFGWVPGKGYHFPQGPYVEYHGASDIPKEELVTRIEAATAEILAEHHKTSVRFVAPEQLGDHCRVVPEGIPTDKPARVVLYGAFGVACGGTHVADLSEIGPIQIRKVKAKGDAIRVSYAIDAAR